LPPRYPFFRHPPSFIAVRGSFAVRRLWSLPKLASLRLGRPPSTKGREDRRAAGHAPPSWGPPLPQGIRPFPRAVHTGRAVDPPVDLAHNFDQVRLKCVTGPGGWPTLYGKNAVLGPPP
jgi:hypothetical protein